MKNITLAEIKDCSCILSDGKHVLVLGKYLWIFRKDGFFVAKCTTIRNPYKAAFLPGNTALVDGLGDGSYHYISLSDGVVLWSTLKKGRRNRPSNKFAVTPDGHYIYDVYHPSANILNVDCICPENQTLHRYAVYDGLRVTNDIFCKEDGTLCVLQSHVITNHQSPAPECDNGILSISFNSSEGNHYWQRRWKSYPIYYKTPRGCDGKHILYNDFSVVNLDTMSEFSLIGSSDLDKLPKHAFNYAFEKSRNLLTVSYIGVGLNIIVDCVTHRIVTRYLSADRPLGYEGCLIENEFWMGTDSGIIRRPFP